MRALTDLWERLDGHGSKSKMGVPYNKIHDQILKTSVELQPSKHSSEQSSLFKLPLQLEQSLSESNVHYNGYKGGAVINSSVKGRVDDVWFKAKT